MPETPGVLVPKVHTVVRPLWERRLYFTACRRNQQHQPISLLRIWESLAPGKWSPGIRQHKPGAKPNAQPPARPALPAWEGEGRPGDSGKCSSGPLGGGITSAAAGCGRVLIPSGILGSVVQTGSAGRGASGPGMRGRGLGCSQKDCLIRLMNFQTLKEFFISGINPTFRHDLMSSSMRQGLTELLSASWLLRLALNSRSSCLVNRWDYRDEGEKMSHLC
ncbi:uncharacterized protein LOC124100175 isoform X3 [Marmota monax]|uniref:uncharacterized protein LOC124100175 isoform X3 n=1 Tax=Marmota monax TaxID=9995 RepID=UPI0026F0D9B2|nr:uncharacterized protein LOC124100175 isoform X3 [Marmota monax]XP_058438961.1 uncharacterized protein LOC124100175 isoform X3 [Marmota monax]